MATWKDVYDEESDSFLNSYNGYYQSTVNGKVYAALQYDEDTITTTSVTLRFKLGCTPLNNYFDEYHVLLDPDSKNRSIHLLKKDYTKDWNDETAKKKWPYYASTTFTSKKDVKDSMFPIPKFWLINDGWNNTTPNTAAEFYANYKVGGRRGPSLRSTIEATTVAIAPKLSVVTNGASPTLAVTDRGTNTCVISGLLGKNGNNNKMQSATLYYTTDGSDPSDSDTRTKVSLTATSGGSYSKSVATTKKCTVKAYVQCKFEHNSTSASASATILYYVAPSKPGTPIIYYTRSRFTPKERIIYNWTAASAGNANSPVVGYRVRLYKKKAGSTTWINTPIWSTTSNKQLSKLNGSSTTDYIYDREVSDTPTHISLGHDIHGVEVGDSVKLSLQAYSRFGANNNGDNSSLLSAVVTSAETLVQNAGVANLKVNGAWKEGQVYVKVSGVWQEAESVNVKVSGAWQESE